MASISMAQSGFPMKPTKNNVGGFVGPYVSVNLVDYVEYGVVGGINFKDFVLVGPYYQKSIKSNDYFGLYTQINVNPRTHYFNLGFSMKSGFVNGKYLSFEPGMSIQHNTMNDRFKFIHAITFVGGWPAYTFGVWIGNFHEKWWKNPKCYDRRSIKNAMKF